jgi:hypothetical protein
MTGDEVRQAIEAVLTETYDLWVEVQRLQQRVAKLERNR